MWLPTTSDLIIIYFRTTIRVKDFTQIISIIEFIWAPGRVNQQVQNYKTCLKNSHFGVEKFNFSLGLSFNFFCIDIILLSV